MTPGELLRSARGRHGVSQRQLAIRAGTTQSAISRIESDRLSPTVDTLSRLLELLGEELQLSAQQIDYGHDRTLLRQNLARTPSERIDQGVALANFVLRNRGAAHRGTLRSKADPSPAR
jgi:transcriptional regulator with XRE-family HTH domain